MIRTRGHSPTSAGEVVDALVLLGLFAGLVHAAGVGGAAGEGVGCARDHVVDVDVLHFALGDGAAGCGVFGDFQLVGARGVLAGHFCDLRAEGAEEGVQGVH